MGVQEAEKGEAQTSAFSDSLLFAGAVLAGALLVFRRTMENQLSWLHAPGSKPYAFALVSGVAPERVAR